MTKKVSQLASSIESHWSLYNLIRDNWGTVLGIVGLTGLNTWLLWLWQKAMDAPIHQQLLAVSFGALFTIFITSGIVAFRASYLRSKSQKKSLDLGLSWSGHAYSKGEVIDGGTHRINEIFGQDQIRSDVLFKNAQISGPGIVAMTICESNKCTYFGLPSVNFIEPNDAIGLQAFQFVQCRFENCVFTNVIFVANANMSGPDVNQFRLTKIG